MKSYQQYIYILNKVHIKYNHGMPLSEIYAAEIKKLLCGAQVDDKIILEIFNWFTYTTVDEFVEENKYEYKIIYCILSKTGLFEDVKKRLLQHLKQHQAEYEERRKNKALSPNHNVDFDKDIIIENCQKLPPDEKILYALLTLFPTRRAVDYRKMLIVQDHASTQDVNFNYYIISEKKFVFNVTKNNELQQFDVPSELHDIILDNINESPYILGKEYTQSQLSLKIKTILKKIYDSDISATELRRLYATKLTEDCCNYAKREEIAKKMNHSVMENYKYSY
jgi:hypothetical protein